MKKIYALMLLVCMAFAGTTFAQVSLYSFSQSSGAYSEIAGGTVLGTTANDEQVFNNSTTGASGPVTNTGFAIGFPFKYNGKLYDKFAVASNGYIVLGTGTFAIANALSTAISTTAPAGLANLISVFNQDLEGQTGSELSYLQSGTTPNRKLTVQWKNYKRYSGGIPMTLNFQVVLNETSNTIALNYGTMTTITSYTSQIGLRGATNADYNNRTTTTDWAATTAGGTNTATISLSSTVFPASGLSYIFTPGPDCTAPVSLAASVTGTPAVATIAGSFTDAPVAPTGYVVVRTASNSQPSLVNGTTYVVGSSPVGKIEYVGTSAGPFTSTGLTASTTYYYWVFSYNSTACIGGPAYSTSATTTSITTGAAANVSSTGAGGLWSSTATWASGSVPTADDNVTIADGSTVTIDLAAVAYSLTVGQGGAAVLDYETTTARTLTVSTNVTIAAGASFNTAASGTIVTHSLALGGNLTNNGTLNFASGTAGTNVNFTGDGNSSFSGAGAVTDLYSLSLNKNVRATTVEINVANFSVRDLTTAATGNLLASNTGTGTLKISGTNSFSGTLWGTATYTIPATLGIWLNNPNFNIEAVTASSTLAGLLRVTAGTFNIGTASGNSMGFNAGSVVIMEGGAVMAAGRFGVAAAANIISYTQSGGIVTVGKVGNTSTTLASFDLGTSTSSTVSITGGTILLPLASTATSGPRDFRNQSGGGITGITGGTLQIGDATAVTGQNFNIVGVIPNLVVTSISASHTATFGAPVTYNNATLDVNIQAGATLNFGNNAFLFVGSNIINNGTLVHNGTSSRFITFKASSNVAYTGSGTVTAPMTSLELQNDGTFTIDPAANNIVVNRVIIFSGSFVNANKLTLGNNGSAAVQIGNTADPTGGGSFDVAPAFNLGTGVQSISYLRVNSAHSTGPEINPTRVLGNLTIDDNLNSLTVVGGPLTVTGTLALANGIVENSTSPITLGSSTAPGTLTGGSALSYMTGKFSRTVAASTTASGTFANNNLFPVGKAASYLPVNVAASTSAGGAVVFTAEAFTTNAGTPGTGVTSLSSTRWEVLPITGGGNLVSAFVKIGDAPIVATNSILQAASAAAVYDGAPSASVFTAGTPNSLGTASALPAAAYTGYFAYGDFTAACAVPTAVSANNVTVSSADVLFTCTSCTGSFIVEYGLTGFTPGTGATAGTGGTVVTGPSSPIALTGLTGSSTYQVYVRQNCGSGSFSVNTAPVSFNTLCASVNIPYLENFDNVTAGTLPLCTVVEDLNGGTTWNTVASGSNSAPNSLRYTYSSSLPGNDWFITKGLNLTGGVPYRLQFYYKAQSASFPEGLEVKYGTANNAAGLSGGTVLFNNVAIVNTAYMQATVDFTPGVSGIYYLGFHAISEANEYYLFVDDVNVTLVPACAAPASISVASVTANSASVSWTGTGSYILEYGASGFTPGTGATAGAGGTVINPATSPQAITGLAGGTAYQVYLRQDCTMGGNGYSANSNVVAFFTLPPNDECVNAIALTPTPLSVSSVGATQSQAGEACGGFTSSTAMDIWFSFTASSDGNATVNVTNASSTIDPIIQVYSGSCGSLTNIGCADATAAGGNETASLSGLVSGNTYLVRVYGYSLNPTGTYNISVSGSALPVTVEYFKGSKQSGGHLLDWKVSCTGAPSVTMELERSIDARHFTSIYSQTATAARCLQPFNFVDSRPTAGINYYRLKSIDIDGKVSYSNIVALLNRDKGFEMVSVAPNPAMDVAILTLTTAQKGIVELVVTDISGKQLSKQRVSVIAGDNQLPLKVAALPSGTYSVTAITEDGGTKTLRFMKQ